MNGHKYGIIVSKFFFMTLWVSISEGTLCANTLWIMKTGGLPQSEKRVTNMERSNTKLNTLVLNCNYIYTDICVYEYTCCFLALLTEKQ